MEDVNLHILTDNSLLYSKFIFDTENLSDESPLMSKYGTFKM